MDTSGQMSGKPGVPFAHADLRKKAESSDSIPKAFLQLTVTFVAEGEMVKSVPFEYGASLDESVYPEIPAKEGYNVQWDKADLDNLHIDTEVTAVYTPYVSALSNKETRENGRPIFFVEGQFDEASYAPKGFSARQTERSSSGTVDGHELIEQWSLSIPDDGQKTHTVRCLSPSGDPDGLEIYVKQGSGWSTGGLRRSSWRQTGYGWKCRNAKKPQRSPQTKKEQEGWK